MITEAQPLNLGIQRLPSRRDMFGSGKPKFRETLWTEKRGLCGLCTVPAMADRLLSLLDHPLIARLQALRFVSTMLVPAAAAIAAGLIVLGVRVATTVEWQLLVLPSIGLFFTLWALLAILWRRSRRSRLQLIVSTVAYEDIQGNAVLQLYVRVLNDDRPTRLNRWCLSGRLGDDVTLNAHHLGQREPFRGRPILPSLFRETTATRLATGEEREGLLWFVFPHTVGVAVISATDLTLTIHDKRGMGTSTVIDIPTLRAIAENTAYHNLTTHLEK